MGSDRNARAGGPEGFWSGRAAYPFWGGIGANTNVLTSALFLS
ncbi:Uncharacterised protein [Bordetella pertussis]|nr:Uncharacterised protein [Bordetella pertussis]